MTLQLPGRAARAPSTLTVRFYNLATPGDLPVADYNLQCYLHSRARQSKKGKFAPVPNQ